MKTHRLPLAVAVLALTVAVSAWSVVIPAAWTDGTISDAFTFQGVLRTDAGLVNVPCDLQFRLLDSETAGTQIGTTVTKAAVEVSNGLFTVQLDFGSGAFNGDNRFLDVAVKCAGDTAFTSLSPRQPVTSAPYALHSKRTPWNGLTGKPAGLDDGDDDTLAKLSCTTGQVAKWTGTAWTCASETIIQKRNISTIVFLLNLNQGPETVVLTPAALIGGFLDARSGFNDRVVTPGSAELVAAIPNAQVGSSWLWVVRSDASCSSLGIPFPLCHVIPAFDIQPGVGATLEGRTEFPLLSSVQVTSTRAYLVVLTNVTKGQETYSVLDLTQG
jgi:hypothetical protein